MTELMLIVTEDDETRLVLEDTGEDAQVDPLSRHSVDLIYSEALTLEMGVIFDREFMEVYGSDWVEPGDVVILPRKGF